MDLTLQKLREMFAGAASDISANEQYLCSLDSVCGDGDHGVAIRGAICASSDALKYVILEPSQLFFIPKPKLWLSPGCSLHTASVAGLKSNETE